MTWLCLVLASAALSGTAVATPWVIRLAGWLGATDAPDGFRKTHAAVTPRMGGLAVAFGLAIATVFYVLVAPQLPLLGHPIDHLPTTCLTITAFLMILVLGLVDDHRGLRPKTKLAWQAVAAMCLFHAGFAIERIFLFGLTIHFGPLALPVTVFWFLGCMNIWNLIDGMDGLASGAGAIVSLTLMVVAMTLGHLEAACGAAALAGALAGFLIYNFHPAKIFLGDTGSLLLGTVLGTIAIGGSLKSGMTVAILVPLLAMGLPIIDTVLAIIRRWIRHLPWSVADHGHLHHRLLAFGLSQRQASCFLYSFTLLLCASALFSLAWQSDLVGLALAIAGSSSLIFVFAARREERQALFADFRRRLRHRQSEQQIAKICWESIQRLPHVTTLAKLVELIAKLTQELGCQRIDIEYSRAHDTLIEECITIDCAEHWGGGDQTFSIRRGDWPGEHLTFTWTENAGGDRRLALAARFLEKFADEALKRVRLIAADLETVVSPKPMANSTGMRSARLSA